MFIIQSKIKSIGALLLGGALLITAGCGDDFETLTDARNDVYTADTLTAKAAVNIDVDTTGENMEYTDQDTIDMLNHSSINIDMQSDNVNQQHEMLVSATLGVSEDSANNLDIPIFLDQQNEAMYTPVSHIANLLSITMFDVEIPEEHQDKVINLMEDSDTESEATALSLSPEESSEIMNDYLDNLPADTLNVDGDVYTQTVNGDDFIKHVMTELVERGHLTSEEVETFQSDFEDITIGDMTIQSTLTDGTLSSEAITIPVSMPAEASDDTIEMTLNMDMVYESINEPIEFTIDTHDDNVMTQEEFGNILMEQF